MAESCLLSGGCLRRESGSEGGGGGRWGCRGARGTCSARAQQTSIRPGKPQIRRAVINATGFVSLRTHRPFQPEMSTRGAQTWPPFGVVVVVPPAGDRAPRARTASRFLFARAHARHGANVYTNAGTDASSQERRLHTTHPRKKQITTTASPRRRRAPPARRRRRRRRSRPPRLAAARARRPRAPRAGRRSACCPPAPPRPCPG